MKKKAKQTKNNTNKKQSNNKSILFEKIKDLKNECHEVVGLINQLNMSAVLKS